MKISIHMILEELSELKPESVINFQTSFTSYNLLETFPDENDVLHICDVTKFVSMNNITERKTFVLIDPLNIMEEVEVSNKINVIAIKDNITQATLINKIIQIFNKYINFELTLTSYLHQGVSLEKILNFIYKSVGIEMHLNDSRGNALYRNSNAYKYYPQTILISKTVRDGKKALGSLALMKSKVLTEDYQMSLFNIISEILDKKLDLYFNDKRDAYLDLTKMVYDNLANSSPLDVEQVSKKLENLGWSINHNYRLFLISSQRYESIQLVIDYLTDQYKKDTLLFKHEGKYILLVNDNKVDSDILISELRLMIDSRSDLKILVSIAFNNILEVSKHYRFLCMLVSKIDFELVDLSVDTIKVLLILSKGIENNVFINSEIRKLKEYDSDSDGDLLETLYAYICYERSLVRTAEKLNVHRNTVVYRVNRINEIINLDLDNPLIRYHTIISILLIEGEGLLKYN
ncbi:PucR family transcriptional regulator [Microaceticoccus formicicus]|uniref:PucR family transcriptional regulator n=1 Tax=Microaceticoccus formicicus TaxID=3118105 RepID=UPI003CD03A58|nr:helix-turn-helix domain-containing protein [Peptoniphilaceae bacterium AMB_02]